MYKVDRRLCCKCIQKQHVNTTAVHPTATGDTTAVDDDEQETCGFCRFMKAGGCRQAFIVRLGCVLRPSLSHGISNNTPPRMPHRTGVIVWTRKRPRVRTLQKSARKRCVFCVGIYWDVVDSVWLDRGHIGQCTSIVQPAYAPFGVSLPLTFHSAYRRGR